MTQLILDSTGYNIVLPESIKKGYTAYEEDLSEDITMISGRMVREIRGTVWRVEYQYGFFAEEEKNRVIAACRKGRQQPISCAFLPPDSDTMIVSTFFVTDFKPPSFMWSVDRKPLWADFSVILREVNPHA